MQDMVRKDFTAGLVSYEKDLTEAAAAKKSVLPSAGCKYETGILEKLDTLESSIDEALAKLDADTKVAEGKSDVLESAEYYQATILSDMDSLRAGVDAAEALIPNEYLSYPTYEEMLFSTR